jgi:hypothetical protein
MNDTVAELRSRPYQMAHVRSATSQNGSTVVDDDARKSDYKRIISNNTGSATGQTGGTQNTVVSIREVITTREGVDCNAYKNFIDTEYICIIFF